MHPRFAKTMTISTIFALCALAGSRATVQALQASPAGGTASQQSSGPILKEDVPLKVDVVISRFEGDKKTSSLPFSLWVSTGNSTSIRMGSEVPIPVTTDGKPGVQYRSVGTSIDTRVSKDVSGGTFRLSVTVQDSSVYAQEKTAQSGATGMVNGYPVIRSFQSNNSLTLRDGQSAEYVMATDKVSGEVLKVNVTLTAVK